MLARDHGMKKGCRADDELTIAYDSTQADGLDRAVHALLREMSSLADDRDCFLKANAVERGTERSW